MASCYGDADNVKACDGLLGQELVQHILPITWKIERFCYGYVIISNFSLTSDLLSNMIMENLWKRTVISKLIISKEMKKEKKL